MIDLSTPQALAAQTFMRHKGLGEHVPYEVEKLDDQPCWYFYYEVDGGTLEIEASWDPTDGWDVMATAFAGSES